MSWRMNKGCGVLRLTGKPCIHQPVACLYHVTSETVASSCTGCNSERYFDAQVMPACLHPAVCLCPRKRQGAESAPLDLGIRTM